MNVANQVWGMRTKSTHEYVLCRTATNTGKCMPQALKRISKMQKWQLLESSTLQRSQWQVPSQKTKVLLASSQPLSCPITILLPSGCPGALLPNHSVAGHLQYLSMSHSDPLCDLHPQQPTCLMLPEHERG